MSWVRGGFVSSRAGLGDGSSSKGYSLLQQTMLFCVYHYYYNISFVVNYLYITHAIFHALPTNGAKTGTNALQYRVGNPLIAVSLWSDVRRCSEYLPNENEFHSARDVLDLFQLSGIHTIARLQRICYKVMNQRTTWRLWPIARYQLINTAILWSCRVRGLRLPPSLAYGPSIIFLFCLFDHSWITSTSF